MRRTTQGARPSLADESGSFALEASVIFPTVFIAVLLLLFAGLFVYERTLLYYSASAAAERAAFRWDNSHRDAVTGIAPTGQYDGLYWRMTDDRLLQSLLGFAEEADRAATVAIPDDSPGGLEDRAAAGLPEAKLRRAVSRIADRYRGEAVLARYPLMKEVGVRLELPGAFAALPRQLGFSAAEASAAAPIADPVELIRTVDLARYYAAKFGTGRSAAEKRAEAGSAVRRKADQAAGGGTAS